MTTERVPLFSGEPPTGLLERAATIVTVLATCTLVASVTYDWGFLSALGLSFGDVPTSLADHARSALVWLPGTALALFLIVAAELFTQRMDDGKTAADFPPPKGCLSSFYVNGPRWLFYISGPIFFLAAGEVALSFVVGLIGATWLVFSYWIVTHRVIGARMSWLARRTFYYGPAVAIYLFGMGWVGGVGALIGPADTAVIAGTPRQTVEVLRQYEAGLLCREQSRISFRRWDSILVVNMNHARRDVWRGYLWNVARRATRTPNTPPSPTTSCPPGTSPETAPRSPASPPSAHRAAPN